MKCAGTIIEEKGDIAGILIESKACDKCHACGFGAVRDEKSMVVNARNGVGARTGDRVNLEVSGKKVMSASAILFMIPFCGFIAGFLLGYFAVWHLFGAHYRTLVSVVLAFLLLAVSYYPVSVLGNRSEFEFVIRSIATGDEPPTPFESPRRGLEV